MKGRGLASRCRNVKESAGSTQDRLADEYPADIGQSGDIEQLSVWLEKRGEVIVYKVVTLDYLICHDLSFTAENKANRPKDSSRDSMQ